MIWHTKPVDLSLTSSVLGVQPLQALSEGEGADAGMLVAGLKSCEVECSGHKSKAGEPIGVTMTLAVDEPQRVPAPPSKPPQKRITLTVTFGDKTVPVQYVRSTPAWLLDKTVRAAFGISFGHSLRYSGADDLEYTLDPARLPDGKKLSVKVVGASKRIALSSSSSAMWFPTLSGMLHSARSTASLNSESAASVQTIATDRSHYKGDLARRMASIPMPEPLPEAPLSARSYSSLYTEGQYKIALLGDCEVGKSTFVARMASNENPREYKFDKEYAPSDRCSTSSVTMVTNKGDIACALWELSGKCPTGRRRDQSTAVYLAGSDAAIIFFSYQQPAESARNVLRWLNLLRRTRGQIPVVICGLGADNKAAVAEWGAESPFTAASCRTGDQIWTPMISILAKLVRHLCESPNTPCAVFVCPPSPEPQRLAAGGGRVDPVQEAAEGGACRHCAGHRGDRLRREQLAGRRRGGGAGARSLLSSVAPRVPNAAL